MTPNVSPQPQPPSRDYSGSLQTASGRRSSWRRWLGVQTLIGRQRFTFSYPPLLTTIACRKFPPSGIAHRTCGERKIKMQASQSHSLTVARTPQSRLRACCSLHV
jgi:hypothetical protein